MKNNEEVAIRVSNVSKSFKLPHEKTNSLKSIIINPFKKRTYEKQQVLDDISFEIKKGEFFGIVGRNGSGKSTLLKLLAGIYSPDKGKIQVNGKLTPFIELGVGFNPELTGRENVFLNGALLGFSRKEMAEMYDEIVEFAELEKFMDQKLKNYSSGMQVRLAFSIAIRANSDILVLDEVLAVGDYNFQQKCFEYFKHLKEKKKTVILVSHDSNALQMFCTQAVLIEKGKVVKIGKTPDVLKAYAKQNLSDQEKNSKKTKSKNATNPLEVRSGKVSLEEVIFMDESGKARNSFEPKELITIRCTYIFYERIEQPVFGLIIEAADGGQPVFATNTLDKNITTKIYKNGEKAVVFFKLENLYNDGRYSVSGAVASKDRSEVYIRFLNEKSFSVVGWNVTAKARFYQDYDLSIK